jgi:hypothetical protein
MVSRSDIIMLRAKKFIVTYVKYSDRIGESGRPDQAQSPISVKGAGRVSHRLVILRAHALLRHVILVPFDARELLRLCPALLPLELGG